MNERTARRVGLLYKLNGEKTSVSTAAGRSYAWFLKLKTQDDGDLLKLTKKYLKLYNPLNIVKPLVAHIHFSSHKLDNSIGYFWIISIMAISNSLRVPNAAWVYS